METEFKARGSADEEIDVKEMLSGQDETAVKVGEEESAQISAFQKEVIALCEKYGIVIVMAGTRRQRQIDEKRTICAGFITSIITKPTAREARTIVRSYAECQEIVARLALKGLTDEDPCDCENCRKHHGEKDAEKKKAGVEK